VTEQQAPVDPRSRESKARDAIRRMLEAQGAIGSQQVDGVPGAATKESPAPTAQPIEEILQESEPETPPAQPAPAKAPKGAGEEGESAVKKRIDQLTAKAKAAEERAAKADKLEAEITKLRSELSQAKREKLPEEVAAEAAKLKGFSEWPGERQQAAIAAIAATRVASEAPTGELPEDVQAIVAHHKMQQRFGGDLTFEQTEALIEVTRGAPGLSDRQLMLVAKDSYPDLFGGTERRGGLPPSHVVQAPSSTGAQGAADPARDDRGRFAQAMSNAQTKKQRKLVVLEELKRRLNRRP
jgi:hypothetical protein